MGLGDAGPVTPSSPVHARCTGLKGARGDAGLAGSEKLHLSAQADGAAAGDATGAVAALAGESKSHGETWRWS